MTKKTLGRKVEMVKMTNESNLHVTFSKRKAGLFKKASELSTLCGAEIALIVFSPGNKAYSFGVPSVNTVIDRYLGRNPPESSIIVEAHRESDVHQLNMEHAQVMGQLEGRKKCCKELKKIEKTNQQQYWFQSPVEQLDLSQLRQLKSAMYGLKNNVEEHKAAILNTNHHHFFLGNSSRGLIHDYNNNMMAGAYNPVQEYNINPANGYSVNFQENDIFDLLEFRPQGFKGGFF